MERLKIQRKQNDHEATPSKVDSSLVQQGMSGTSQALETTTRETLEPQFGHSFENIRIFADDRAAQSADALHANAYTVGSNIVFNSGRYQPNSSDGQRLIAHELTHSVQQGGLDGNQSLPTELEVNEPANISEVEAETVSSQITLGQLDANMTSDRTIVSSSAPPLSTSSRSSFAQSISNETSLSIQRQSLPGVTPPLPGPPGGGFNFDPKIFQLPKIAEPFPAGPIGARGVVVAAEAGEVAGTAGTASVVGVGTVAVVIVAGLVVGIALPFGVGYVIERSEEVNQNTDPDERSLPGGVPPQANLGSDGDAGAGDPIQLPPDQKSVPTDDPNLDHPSPKPYQTPMTDPTPTDPASLPGQPNAGPMSTMPRWNGNEDEFDEDESIKKSASIGKQKPKKGASKVADLTEEDGKGAPGTNDAQDSQFKEAIRRIELIRKRSLDRDEVRKVHDAISKGNFDIDQMVNEGLTIIK